MATERQATLDMVRGGAIAAVLLFHVHDPTGYRVLDAVIAPFARGGWIGVDVFFVLSGFLVGGIVLRALDDGEFDRRAFFERRAWRLWPVLALYLAMLAASGAGVDMVLPVLLHVQNYGDAAPSHLWSLAVEEHFYLLLALVLPALYRWRGATGVIHVLVALILGVTALRCGALFAGEAVRAAQWQTQYRLDAPAAGVLLAAVRHHRPDQYAAAQRRRSALLAGGLLGIYALTLTADDATRQGPGLTVAWMAAAMVIVAMDGTALRPTSAGRALAWLGRISYPLYIWHASVAKVTVVALAGIGIDHGVGVLAGQLVMAIAAAALLHRLVERPMMRFGRHRSLSFGWPGRRHQAA